MDNNKKKIIIKKKAEKQGENQTEKREIETMKTNEESLNSEKNEINDFAKLFEESIQDKRITSNQIVTGIIVEVREDVVFVDIGYKSEGIVDINDFATTPEIGEEVEVFIVSMENQNGELILSKKRADSIKTRREIEKSYSDKTTIKGTVLKDIKGGFIVNIDGSMEAFVPLSHIDTKRNVNPKDYIDKTFDFKITKYEKKQKQTNIVLSRRLLLEEEIKEKKEKLLNQIKVNDVIEGTIKTVLEYGVFINLGAIDGFAHLKDLSWGHIKHPKDLFRVGDKIKAMVIDFSKENEKIHLGIKQLIEDPWNIFIKEYKVGDTVKGEVTKLSEYGAFVKLFEGVEGLLHVSEMSWTKRIKHPKEILKVKDIIETKILDIDKENKKLSLSLKELLVNPWDDIENIMPVGKKVQGKVKNIVKTGIFVDLIEGLEGFLPQNELDWLNKNVNMKREYKRNDEIEVVILQLNKNEKKILLGRKQLTDNPYKAFIDENPKGSVVSGKIVKITEFGAFVKLADKIDGMIPKSHISKKKFENISDIVKEGDTVNCIILDSDLIKNKITLSIKNYERNQERKFIEQYTTDNDSDDKVTLGDIIDLNNFNK
jgi:small subunit ribosomal protein S1